MSTIKSFIQNHTTNLLSNHTTPVVARSCRCRQKSECPLNNECLSQSLVYKAAVSQTPSQINKLYYETCEKTFKERYNNHTLHLGIIAKRKVRNSLTLWELNRNSIQHQFSWDIALRAHSYNG